MSEKALFDELPDFYEQWFTTPIGRLVKDVEWEMLNELIAPKPGEYLLDAGCGTGIFTTDILAAGTRIVGLDISGPMLRVAKKKIADKAFSPVQGDIRRLPFGDNSFDKAVSITALEFVAEAETAVNEMFRVTKPGGCIIVATLNSLSQWAVRRRAKTLEGDGSVLDNAFFRSPDDLIACSPYQCTVKTAVHFKNDDDPTEAVITERHGRSQGLDTGAMVAARWEKR